MTAFDQLPTAIVLESLEIPINTDFRASIAFEDSMQHIFRNPDKAIEEMLLHYFDDTSLELIVQCIQSELVNEFVSAVMGFYSLVRSQKQKETQKKSRPLYSFTHDSERIYAAFRQYYGMDLYTVEHLHWHKFRALFSALPEDSEIVRIMHIRGAKPEKGMTAKERASLRRTQAAYALPELRTEEEIEADFVDGFVGMF